MKQLLFLLSLFGTMMLSCSNDIMNKDSIKNDSILTVDQIAANLQESFLSKSTRLDENQMMYPPNYGGSYIDSKGDFVILVKGNAAQNSVKGDYKARTKATNIELLPCEYSYNELLEMKNSISKFFANKKNYSFINQIEWSSLGISDKDNRVIVQINCTTKNINLFKRTVSSSSMIKFEQSEGFPIGYATQLRPGSKLSTNYLSGSIGYKAKNSMGELGIVTAGHVACAGLLVSFDGNVIGTAEQTQMEGTVDASFIPYENSFTFSNETAFGYTYITTTVGTILQGSSIKCEGYHTASVMGGDIKNTSIEVYADMNVSGSIVRLHFSDFIQTTVSVLKGDSGGICYQVSNRNPIGIISCGTSSYTYMCKISNINKAFSLTLN